MSQESYCPFELEASWRLALKEEWEKAYPVELAAFVEKERAGEVPVYPPRELVFNAFQNTSFQNVKVVIMGQDPYHGPGQAHGLSFSVPYGIPPPPSLKNIYKELEADVGMKIPNHGCLLNWTKQGVLLLNALLTVRQGAPMSHQGKGWERLTDAVIAKLSSREDPPIFVLWGKKAKDKCQNVLGKGKKHHILSAAHPSPLSAHSGFFGCRHFSKINEILIKKGKGSINWSFY